MEFEARANSSIQTHIITEANKLAENEDVDVFKMRSLCEHAF